jgi:hypothetical protein
MLKKHEIADPKSCLNKAAADEPVFVLRAKDPLAPDIIRLWAAEAQGVHEVEKCTEANQIADDMESWRKANVD